MDFSKFQPCRPLNRPAPKPIPKPSEIIIPTLKPIPDCTLCVEPMVYVRKCRSCRQAWCRSCDENIAKCPYCRTEIPGRRDQEAEQIEDNLNWYYESDSESEVVSTEYDFDDVDAFVAYLLTTRT